MDNNFKIDILEKFSSAEPITKGWSKDKKYCVESEDGTKFLLRISELERHEERKELFEMLKRVDSLEIPMCRPVEFGTCADGVYTLHSWIDGEDLEPALQTMPETEHFMLGIKSGEILRKIHSIPARDSQEDWASLFNRKTDLKMQKYSECGLRFKGDEHVIEYIENNRHLLENRPQCFQHGDYHVGNMMIEDGELKIIDFDRFDFGDPWEEFNRIVFSASASPHFATGQLRGYFGGEPPIEFFKLLAFYISSNTLSSIYWAIPFGDSDIEIMMNQSQDVLRWYDNMQNPIPTWYLKDYEVWDILDKDGNKTGRFHERGKPMATGDYHVVVHVWNHNGRGEWLIDKRSPQNKESGIKMSNTKKNETEYDYIIYVDASGDDGLKFEKGSSLCFVASSVIIHKDDMSHNIAILNEIKKLMGGKVTDEVKYSKVRRHYNAEKIH
ncbi:MAG: phosphotransferase, partial [Oscillospiraceae bacterium]|nr:phosphotransferase [Oscillospiraceae bacterium]